LPRYAYTVQRATGRALFLTGPSGVGKSAVARRLQYELPDPWLFYEVDQCQPRTSPKQPAGFDPADAERRFAKAMFVAAHAYVAEGFDAIIEMDIAGDWRQGCLREVFTLVRTFRIVLTCDSETLEQRLASRGGPVPVDWARRHWAGTDWRRVPADLIVATDGQTVEQTVERILGRLRLRS
jgi:chloramphenicol 3-O-phosphotransferase